MKNYLVIGLCGSLLASCVQPGLSEDEVRAFATSHIENQVGYAAAVEGYYAGAASDLKVWSNPVWKNVPRDFVVDENDDGSLFYEDSIKVTLHDVYLMGGHANVMGTIQWYIAGVNTTYRNFSGIVTEEGGQLKWSRFVAVDNQTLSKGFLWPSTELEGGMSAYGEMRSAMMNLEFERAKAISDSLVAADPNWATAHLGQLQYHWVKRDVESLNATRAIAESKLEGASRAEAHFIKSYTTDRDAGDHHLEQALIFAPADPMVRVWYAWGQEDPERAIDIMKIAWDRLPEQGGVNNMMGYKYMAAGNMEKAKQHFEIFVRANADVANAYDSYGEYYLTVGDTAMAKEMYMKAYETNNNWTASKERADEL